MIKIYDYTLSTTSPVALLQNAFNITYELRENEIGTASFSMPATDPKNAECLAFRFAEIYDGPDRVELFQILPSAYDKSGDTKIITYDCIHVLSTLLNDILFQYNQRTGYTISQNITFILGYQSVARWTTGTVGFTDVIDFKWENENLISALFSMPKALTGPYQWTYDTSSYPWELNLIAPSTASIATLEYSHNLIGINRVIDPSEVITRLYPLGYGEGINQLDIKSVNSGVAYLDASTIGTYGVIAAPFISKETESAATLKKIAAAYLETVKTPKATYSASAADIFGITRTAADNLRSVGATITIIDPDLGTFDAKIVSLSKSDLTGAPGDMSLEISNKVLDTASQSTSIETKQKINDVYAQGATNIDSNDYQDNCDHAHPATIQFYLPNETVRVNKCLLSFDTTAFRAYESSIASGGSGSVTSGGGGGTTQTSAGAAGWTVTDTNTVNIDIMGGNGGATATSSVAPTNPHSHTWDPWNHDHDSVLATTSHAHGLAGASHTHDVTLADHSHSVSIPGHAHGINYGIYEFGYLPPSLVIKVDGTTIPTTTLSADDVDIVPYLSATGGVVNRGTFHTIEIYPDTDTNNPSGLARITACVTKMIFIQSRGTYTV